MALIYLIENVIDGTKYVGQTKKTLQIRMHGHKSSVNKGSNTYLHRAMRKYGIENFRVCILENDISQENINEAEKRWVSYYNTYNNGYNMTAGGDGKFDFKMSDETRKKISESNKLVGKETYKKRNETLKNKDADFLKNIGLKSGATQKRNGKHKGANNANFSRRKILLFDGEGNLLNTFIVSEMVKLDRNDYPVRMMEESLITKKRMFRGSLNGTPSNIRFHGWHCCYEDELWMNIHKMKVLRKL